VVRGVVWRRWEGGVVPPPPHPTSLGNEKLQCAIEKPGCVVQEVDNPAYREAMRDAHEACAERLHNLCAQNGGIYVKAAQFIASMQTTPVEYRRSPPPFLHTVGQLGSL